MQGEFERVRELDAMSLYTKDKSYLDYKTLEKLQLLTTPEPKNYVSPRGIITNLNDVGMHDPFVKEIIKKEAPAPVKQKTFGSKPPPPKIV